MGHLLANYHTHNRLCNHAVGNCEDYVKTAIELNMEKICFTEHHDIGWFFDGNTSMIDMDKYTGPLSIEIYINL